MMRNSIQLYDDTVSPETSKESGGISVLEPLGDIVPAFQLGQRRHVVMINSLAPLRNLFTSSSQETPGPEPGAATWASLNQSVEQPSRGDFTEPVLEISQYFPRKQHVLYRQHFGDAIIQLRVALSENVVLTAVSPISRAVVGPVHYAAGVDNFARREGATGEVSAIANLCLRLVPEAERVVVTVKRDPEDGISGLHFEVITRADVETVIKAEDQLHQELFSTLPPAKRQFFSIGYHFVR